MADERQPKIIFTAEDRTAAVFASLKGELGQVGKAIDSARALMGTLGVALSAGAFIAATKGAAEAADAAAKMGDRFGIATEEMIGMQHAGDLAGASNQALAQAMKELAKHGTDAARGNEEAAKAFRHLHIDASEFVKLPMDRQLSTVIDRLGQVENVALRNALANQTLGKSYGELMGLVSEGSEAFAKAIADAKAWGLAIDRVDAAKIEMANDAMKRAQAATQGMFTTIAVHLSPTIVELMNQFSDAAAESHGFREEISFLDTILKSAASMALAAQDIIFGLGHQIAGLAAAIGAAASGQFRIAAELINEVDAEVLQHTIKTNERIEAIWKATGSSIDAEARKIAARRQAMMRGSPEDIDQDKTFDEQTARLAQQLEALLAHNRSAEQIIRDSYNNRQALLDESVAKGIITDDFWQGQSMLVFAQSEAEKTRLLDEETKKRYGISQFYRQLDLASASAFMGQMATMMSSKSRAAFEVGKVAAIAETIIQTYRGAQGAFAAFAKIHPALGYAAAAAATVAGLARVQQIRATQFGGGAAAPVFNANPATGVPSAPISPLSAPPGGEGGQVVINVSVITNGNVIGVDGMEKLVRENVIPIISNEMNNNSVRLFGPNSRQAQDLAPA
jgi:plasmid maintenance system antidote protein VapI/Skp family chaperone for outer membrane proteins